MTHSIRVLLSVLLLAASSSAALAQKVDVAGKPIIVSDLARRIHSTAPVVDGHNDLPWALRQAGGSLNKVDIANAQPTLHTDIPRLRIRVQVVSKPAYADSYWARERPTMRSTSGGAIMWGSHLIKRWPSIQNIRALSSGEAEVFAMIEAACQVKGIISLAADFGIELDATVKNDSTAALGMVHGTGLGGRTLREGRHRTR